MIQEVEQTREEKMAMYMKLTKRELVEMLIESDELLEEITINSVEKTNYFPCSCGEHIMQVNSNLDFHDDGKRYNQNWNFAMFDYAGYGKSSLWYRIKVACKYLISGKMFNDKIILSENEADKLVKFIEENNFGKCIDHFEK